MLNSTWNTFTLFWLSWNKQILKKSKCAFFKKELHYLGHLLTTDGIKPQTEKIKAISEMKPPTNQKRVREFLGMVGYYRKFISRFADATRPMTKLTRKDTKFEWSDDCQSGVEYLKSCLTESPILKYPNPQKDMLYSLMPVIKLQQQCSLRNTKIMTMRSKRCLLLTFLHSFLTHNSSGALLLKKGMQFTMPLRNGGTTIYYAIKK